MEFTEEKLQEARQAWLVDESKRVEPKFTTSRIAEKTGYTKGTVSNYLNGKGYMSLDFIKIFCEKYEYNFDAVNHMLIDKIKASIQNNSDNSNSRKADNKSLNEPLQSNNNDIPSGTKTEEVEDMTTTLMLMHKETIEVMRSLSRSFEDVAKANLIQAQMLRQRFGIDENESEEQSFKKAV